MNPQKFRGTGVALVTPFNNKDVDYEALSDIIEYVIDGGVDYIVSLGTTGEAVTLSREECRQVFDFTIKKVDGRKPIVAGLFGSNYTDRLVEALKSYDLSGFDAIMSSSPAYNKPPQEGIYQHYMRVGEASPLPIILYNVPGRTGSNVEAETTLRLAEASDKFIAIKEASGDLQQAGQIIKHKPDNFLVISGEDAITLPMMSFGGDGAISVIANLYPAHYATMVRAALEDDYYTATRIHLALLEVHPWLYVDGNPAGVKAGMAVKDICNREVRIPLTSISKGNYQSLKQEMAKVPRLEDLLQSV